MLDAFRSGGLAEARIAVSMIVGRDPESLDEAGVSRAAIESCAENFSDGVVAPVLWFALLGLPGLLIYKMINTADSMIGHRTPRHADFGWASAKVDDLVNWPAARLSILFIAAGAFSVRRTSRSLRTHRTTGMQASTNHRMPDGPRPRSPPPSASPLPDRAAMEGLSWMIPTCIRKAGVKPVRTISAARSACLSQRALPSLASTSRWPSFSEC